MAYRGMKNLQAQLREGPFEQGLSTSPIIQTKEVEFLAAAIKTLRATPGVCIAAPGAAKLIEVISVVGLLDTGTNVLTESTANLQFRYTGGGNILLMETTGFIDQAADTTTRSIPANDLILSKANAENKAVEVFNNGAGEFGGNAANDAKLRFKISFRVWDTGF